MGHLDSQRSLPVVRPDKLGFSPMAKKLRLAAEHRAAIVNAPAGYLAELTPGPADMTTDLQPNQTYDAVVLFVKDVEQLRRRRERGADALERREVVQDVDAAAVRGDDEIVVA